MLYVCIYISNWYEDWYRGAVSFPDLGYTQKELISDYDRRLLTLSTSHSTSHST
jgi:hypothetical protein